MIARFAREGGISVIEVMISLVVMMFAALSISNLHTSSLKSMEMSKAHFRLSEYSQQILETLRANPSLAKTGDLNVSYSDKATNIKGTEPAKQALAHWVTAVARDFPDGAAQTVCNSQKCTVSIRWKEFIDGSSEYQYFHIAGLM